MPERDHEIARLEARLENLVRTQIGFQTEITAIRDELSRLKGNSAAPQTAGSDGDQFYAVPPARPVPHQGSQTRPLRDDVEPPSFGFVADDQDDQYERSQLGSYIDNYIADARENLEKFIGENLISKIGIIVLVLGVGIGSKYAIDNDLISPVTRILLGYGLAAALFVVGARLKPRYHNFSAVIVSGAFAMTYFLTYFSYSSYGLIPQALAFAVMALLTVATVGAALVYDRQVIAHIGLVGGYAVPFLLSDNSGKYLFLFAYMAVLNVGILAISVKKAWKPIFYTASIFTWLIFAGWLAAKYSIGSHFYLALIFSGIFFAIFYATKIVHGLVHSDSSTAENIASVIATTLIFYAVDLAIGNGPATTQAYAVYFAFLALAGLAILLTSFRFYGRVLVFVVYPLTWLIFACWFINWYSRQQHFEVAALSAAAFFVVFYGATLVYRMITDELGMAENMALLLTNSFIFYGAGYWILDSRENLRQYEGLFTGAHALFHSLVAQAVIKYKRSSGDMVQCLIILIITFTTIAVPVQFDGNHITLIWTIEAAALIFVGRFSAVRMFEYLSYPVLALAITSMASDWVRVYGSRFYLSAVRPSFANGEFVTGLVFVGALTFIFFFDKNGRHGSVLAARLRNGFGYAIAVVGLFALYNVIRMEIGGYFYSLALTRGLTASNSTMVFGATPQVQDLGDLNAVSQIDYTLLFLTLVCAVNLRVMRSAALATTSVGLAVLTLFFVATVGMGLFYGLRVSYLSGTAVQLFGYPEANVLCRYVTYLLMAGLFIVMHRTCGGDLLEPVSTRARRSLIFDTVLYVTILITSSCELTNLASQFHIADARKYGLSILWGVLALVVIGIGIARSKKHLRIGAIVLLGATLAKLFLYDITELGTIPKTALFVSLGLLLLLISFLYNKYKDVIFAPTRN